MESNRVVSNNSVGPTTSNYFQTPNVKKPYDQYAPTTTTNIMSSNNISTFKSNINDFLPLNSL